MSTSISDPSVPGASPTATATTPTDTGPTATAATPADASPAATAAASPPATPPRGFADLSLAPALLAAVERLGYDQPTPIQEQAIPQIVAGRDVVGCAQTGTGKTAAFVLPILQRLGSGQGVRALVVTPTRELCAQIEEVARIVCKDTGQHVVAVYGGVPYEPQVQKVRRGVDLVIATPGRLLDMIQRGDLTLAKVEMLVLDEADRMLDMGFWPDVQRIIRKLPERRQNLLFSATMSRGVLEAVRDTLRDPVRIQIGEVAMPVDEVEQAVYPVNAEQKTDLLVHFLRNHRPKRALIFTRTKHRADRLERQLARHGIKGTIMHSNRTQQQREKALEGFKGGRYSVLIATDIVARGIDVDGISHVVNYDIPLKPEDYVHRIGRTARAGARGEALILLTAEDVHELKAIERLIGAEIERRDLPGFEYEHRHIPDSKDVPKRPGKLLYRGGAQRAMQRGFRFTKPRAKH
jgi:ATP-dependent RNA helicase RhlE